jgi:outer membrane murein-binding lipoprotein Lpp
MIGAGEVLVLLAAVAGSGSMVGLLAWIHGRLGRLDRENSLLRSQSERLAIEVDALREELVADRERIARLAERAEFTERLLANPGTVAKPERTPDK